MSRIELNSLPLLLILRGRRTPASETANSHPLMTDHPSPATRLHDVVVVQEQSHAEWRADRGAIRKGLVVILPRDGPPAGFFCPRATYSVRATDGGNRTRVFPNLSLSQETSRPPKEYVFD